KRPLRSLSIIRTTGPSFRPKCQGETHHPKALPDVLMIENDRSGLLWRLMRSCRYIRSGLQRAGFEGGWLRELEPG
ncbi:MAG: hypothetical protein E5V36_28370, partial [Mesorhizobium sp.]